jgi:hypothetical protein
MAESLKGCYQANHPAGSSAELMTLSKMGEGEYDRYSTSRAFAWISANIGEFIRLTITRTIQFWLPDPVYHVHAYSLWAVTILSAVGAWFLGVRSCLFLVGAAVMYSLPYYIVVSDVRYRYPVLWMSLLMAGATADRVWSAVERFRRARISGLGKPVLSIMKTFLPIASQLRTTRTNE